MKVHEITDIDGGPLRSACFELWTNNNGVRGTKIQGTSTCDALDGVDGTTTVEWATGTYVLVQSIKPQDHYFAPDTVVTFVNGETHEVTVLNESYPL